MPPRTQFLHRRSYRLRRIADAARLLPMAGVVLLLIPLLLLGGGAMARTSMVGVYIFLVWLGLVVLSYLLSRGLRDPRVDLTRDEADP